MFNSETFFVFLNTRLCGPEIFCTHWEILWLQENQQINHLLTLKIGWNFPSVLWQQFKPANCSLMSNEAAENHDCIKPAVGFSKKGFTVSGRRRKTKSATRQVNRKCAGWLPGMMMRARMPWWPTSSRTTGMSVLRLMQWRVWWHHMGISGLGTTVFSR